MTYAEYLLVFLVIPLALALILARRSLGKRLFLVLGIVSVVAIVYTGPWDSAIIANGVWSYRAGQVTGILIAHVPLEEYGFYVLQTFLVGTATAIIVARRRDRD